MIRVALLILSILCVMPIVNSQEKKPSSYSVERYSVIWQKSMFTRQSKQKDQPTNSIYWDLAGVFGFEGGIGAIIVNQSTGAVEQVEMEEENASGLLLVDVIENEATGAASVKIQDGDKTFWVSKLANRKPKPEKETQGPEMLATQPFDRDLQRTVASQ